MTEEPGPNASPRDKPQAEREEEAALARTYREAATGDAWHERKGGGPGTGGRDPTLVPTDEVPDKPMPDVPMPDVPMPDVTHPYPANGEARGFNRDYKGERGGAAYEAELDGLEPGEMMAGEEPAAMMPEQVTKLAEEREAD